MPLRPLDVIWAHDDLIKPPGPKMFVCLAPEHGLFVRINTKGWRRGSVPVAREPHHLFLEWDSHVECGSVFELDDYVIEQSIERGRGVIGRLCAALALSLIEAVRHATTVRETDKAIIAAALVAFVPPSSTG